MKITKSQIKKLIREELASRTEVEYDEGGNPMYYEPVEGEVTPDDAEVLVRGYGGLRIDQIRRKISRMLKEMGWGGSVADFVSFLDKVKREAETRGVLSALVDTLKAHNALEHPEESSEPTE